MGAAGYPYPTQSVVRALSVKSVVIPPLMKGALFGQPMVCNALAIVAHDSVALGSPMEPVFVAPTAGAKRGESVWFWNCPVLSLLMMRQGGGVRGRHEAWGGGVVLELSGVELADEAGCAGSATC